MSVHTMNIQVCFRSWSLLPRIQAKRQSLGGLPKTSLTSPPLSGHSGAKVRTLETFPNKLLEIVCAHFTLLHVWSDRVSKFLPVCGQCASGLQFVKFVLVRQNLRCLSFFGIHNVAHTQPLRWRPSWRPAACHWQCGHVACWYLFDSYTTQQRSRPVSQPLCRFQTPIFPTD